jgi:hypothetical protein
MTSKASKPARSLAALGFRSHSGWACLVAVAGSPADPAVAVRRRIELSRRTPRQPFHAAEGKPFAAAEALVRRSTEEAFGLAEQAVREAVEELKTAGHDPVAAGLLLASGRPLPGLREILGSHALIHAAEGELFRDAIRQASGTSGLRLAEVKDRDVEDEASRALRRAPADLRRRITAWGKLVGSPWTQDEKRAALAAWLALVRSRNVDRGTEAGP